MILETEETEILTSAQFNDMSDNKEKPQMRFYYPADGETLWSIGKQFGVSVSEITEKNSIADGKIPRVVFIPYAK